MTEKAVHVALYPSDWLAGTRGLTPAETGVYITLVCMMYERQDPLPFDLPRLARMCNCPAGTFRKILDSLLDQRKLIETPDGLWQERVEKEIKAAQDAMDEASERGRKGAEARWSKVKPQSDHREIAKVKPQSVEQKAQSHTAEKVNKISEGKMRGQCSSNANQNQNQNQSQKYKIRGGGIGASASADPTWREQMLAAMSVDPSGLTGPSGKVIGQRVDLETAQRWETDLGLSRNAILTVLRETSMGKRDGPPSSFRYFNRAMQREAARLAEAPLQPASPSEVNHDRQPARDRREAAADDRLRRRLDAASRID